MATSFARAWMLQASPEFKGIKTQGTEDIYSRAIQLQASPEFKGIKTCFQGRYLVRHRFKPALNSKGLRPCTSGENTVLPASSQP